MFTAPADDDVTILCMTAGTAYESLAWTSLGLRTGDLLDDLIYEDEFIAAAARNLSVDHDALICLLFRTAGGDACPAGSEEWGDRWGVLPLRWADCRPVEGTAATLADSGAPGLVNSHSFRVSLGLTVHYHDRACVSRRMHVLAPFLARRAVPPDPHVETLKDRNLAADHPFLVTRIPRRSLEEHLACDRCAEALAGTVNLRGRKRELGDAAIWERTLRHVVPVLQNIAPYALSSVGNGLLRLVGVDKVDDAGSSVPVGRVIWSRRVPPAVVLEPRSHYRLLLRSRIGPRQFEATASLGLVVELPEHLGLPGVSEQRVGAGTRDHQIDLYMHDTSGHGVVELSLVQPDDHALANIRTPIRVVRKSSGTTRWAYGLIVFGFLATVLAPFFTKWRWWWAWTWDQGLTVAGVIAAAAGAALLASRQRD